MGDSQVRSIGFLLQDGVSGLDAAGAAEVFARANRIDPVERPVYRLIALSRRGGPVLAQSGLVVQTQEARCLEDGSTPRWCTAGPARAAIRREAESAAGELPAW